MRLIRLSVIAIAAITALAGTVNARVPSSAPSNVGQYLHPPHCWPHRYTVTDKYRDEYFYYIDSHCIRHHLGMHIGVH